MAIEFDDNEVQELLEEKRHEEILGALKNVAKSLSEKDDKQVVAAINENGKKATELLKAISEKESNEKKEIPEIKVELNPSDFVSSAKQICADIIASNNKVIEALENRMLPDTFTLNRGYSGQTDSVKVNYKAAKEINKNKK